MDMMKKLRGGGSIKSSSPSPVQHDIEASTVVGNPAAIEDESNSIYEIDVEDAISVLSIPQSHKSSRSLVSRPTSSLNGHTPSEESPDKREDNTKKSILKQTSVKPSYKLKNDIKSVLLMSSKQEIQDVNTRFKRTRRYDTAGKYRIGPTFITKARLSYLDANKPAKLSVIPDPSFKSLEFGLLTYLWTFTDQHDKTEIDLAFLQSLINSGVDINAADEYGQTALHAMVRDWHPDVVSFIVRNNADVNKADKWGRTPLHLAAAINSVEIAKILCLSGARVDLETDSEHQTPMHYAAKYNSLATMKLLIKFDGSITQRDAQNRTVLFLAAEQGSTETAQFLLDIGAPAGIYDSEGNSCISYLLEKMPHVAYCALHQFVVTNMSLKQSHMYLKHLENSTKGKTAMIQKSPLEIITIYDDTELVMHPVIQKAIDIKWKLFGRMDTVRKLFITLIYLVCWLVLAYTFRDDNTYYRPWSSQGWKIAFELLVVAFAIYFFYKDVMIKKDAMKYHTAWVEWRQHLIRSNYRYCHPSWPNDRENLEAETERIRSVPSLGSKEKTWFLYEWFMLIVLAAIIATRILTMTVDSKPLFIAHKCIFGVGIIFSFLRVLKILNRFRFFAVFLKISSLVLLTTVQVSLLYIQLYIPFTAVFWLNFGNNEVLTEIQNLDPEHTQHKVQWTNLKNDTNSLVGMNNIFYHVYTSSFGQGMLGYFVEVKKTEAQTLITLYHIFVSFIIFSVFVALITSKFTTHYSRMVAEASLLRASIVLQLEKNLKKEDKAKLTRYYKQYCNPLVVPMEAYTETILKRNALSKLRLSERRLNGIENIVTEAEMRFLANDQKNQKSVLESIASVIALLQQQEKDMNSKLETNLKELTSKQEYMNKYLPKLLKLTS